MNLKAMKMVREIRDRQYEATKEMSPEEQRVYFQSKAEALRQRIEKLKRRAKVDQVQ